MSKPEAYIIGAGLSGLSAAVALTAAGYKTNVYESSVQAGGRCRSFWDDEIGAYIDNGNHLILGANKSVFAFLKVIGNEGGLIAQEKSLYPFIDIKSGKYWNIHLNKGKIPWWIFSPKRRVPDSTWVNYLTILRLAIASRKSTVKDCLGQNSIMSERLWDPICKAVLNIEIESASARLLWPVIKLTFGGGAEGSKPYFTREGLSKALIEPAIEFIEKTIVERAFEEGWIKPMPPETRTNKKVAVIGSGPAGLAAAQQLNRAGHNVTVFERDNVVGGLLSLGIPEFKLEKWVVKRRIDLMKKEGINFKTNINVGENYSTEKLDNNFDAICLAGGSTIPRDLEVEGRDLKGIYYAMEYLTQQNNYHEGIDYEDVIHAEDKHVVILGGGDTGADCLGTSHRQGANSVTQLELMSAPPNERSIYNPWPEWPLIMRTSSAHEEGGERDYSVMTKKLSGKNGRVTTLHAVKIEFVKDTDGNTKLEEIPNSEFEIKADLVLLAMGFLHPQKKGLIQSLKLELDSKGNVKTDQNMMSSKNKYFACGDMNHGQSLVVRAIASGRECARNIDQSLMGSTKLPKVRGFSRASQV